MRQHLAWCEETHYRRLVRPPSGDAGLAAASEAAGIAASEAADSGAGAGAGAAAADSGTDAPTAEAAAAGAPSSSAAPAAAVYRVRTIENRFVGDASCASGSEATGPDRDLAKPDASDCAGGASEKGRVEGLRDAGVVAGSVAERGGAGQALPSEPSGAPSRASAPLPPPPPPR